MEMTKRTAIALVLLSCAIHAGGVEKNDWHHIYLPDGTSLKVDMVRRTNPRGPEWEDHVKQLILRKPDNSETVIWEKVDSMYRVGGGDVSELVIEGARRFGSTYSVVLGDMKIRGPFEFMRIDSSHTPPTLVHVHLHREVPYERVDRSPDGAETNTSVSGSLPKGTGGTVPRLPSGTVMRPPVAIENEKEVSYRQAGADKVLYHVDDNGHVTRNGTPFPAVAYLNGEYVGVVTEEEPEAMRVWALGSSGHASGNGSGSEATGPLAALAEATGIRRLPGGWPLLATSAACLAGAASWLLFRARQRRNKQGQRTENGG